MSTMMTTITRWQDEYLRLLDRVEAPVVKFTGRAATTVAEYVPERPDWALLDDVPTVRELVDSQLKFRRRVVDHQAAFVRMMMKAMHPALVRIEPKAPAKRASKPVPVRRSGPKAA